MTEQVLGANLYTYCTGARVCKTWSAIQESDHCRILSLVLFGTGEYGVDEMAEILQNHASTQLTCLGFWLNDDVIDEEKLMAQVSRYSSLLSLQITSQGLENWNAFNTVSVSLVTLDLSPLWMEYIEMHDGSEEPVRDSHAL